MSVDPPQHLTREGRKAWYAAREQVVDKERIARRLRAHIPPHEVMAETRLREVVNGSPGSIVQVLHEDLQTILRAYADLRDSK